MPRQPGTAARRAGRPEGGGEAISSAAGYARRRLGMQGGQAGLLTAANAPCAPSAWRHCAVTTWRLRWGVVRASTSGQAGSGGGGTKGGMPKRRCMTPGGLSTRLLTFSSAEREGGAPRGAASRQAASQRWRRLGAGRWNGEKLQTGLKKACKHERQRGRPAGGRGMGLPLACSMHAASIHPDLATDL